MKRIYLQIVTMFFFSVCTIQAQTEDKKANEITVTNAQGKQEVIDVPEAMNTEVDSLPPSGYRLQSAQRESDLR